MSSRRGVRVRLGIHVNIDGSFSVHSCDAADYLVPEQPADFQSWADAGWFIARPVHGNEARGAQVTIEKGRSVAKAPQAILGIEKDGKRFRVAARWVYGGQEPEDWKKLDSWADAGWRVKDTTGNLEHGAFWTMTTEDPADQPGGMEN